MNIPPNTANLPLATVVNLATENLRRENNQREVISQVAATNSAAAEKGVASDKDRGRSPTQANQQFDFTSLQNEAEQKATSITEQESRQNQQQNRQQSDNDSGAENTSGTATKDNNDEAQQLLEEKVISQLKIRDREVRAHEMAHANIGGTTTGTPSYTFEVGPDGKKYAVSGEVDVDLSIVTGDPQATIVKMQKVYAAALAPISPSIQDTRVAASATQKILTAQSELLVANNETLNKSIQGGVEGAYNAEKITGLAAKPTSNNNYSNRLNDSVLTIQPEFLSDNDLQKFPSFQQPPLQQSVEVKQRADRIEFYYNTISQGMDKPNTYQFKLMA
jgi:hypothetical protein